jgi:hypothetical protein
MRDMRQIWKGWYSRSTNVFTSFKAYRTKTGTTFGVLQNPHADFYNYITELEAAFVNHFDEALNSAQVGQFLLNVCRTFRLFTLALNFPSVLPFVCL